MKQGQAPRQLDYILASERWARGVSKCRVDWRPSKHRFGHSYDHGLLLCEFKFRVHAAAKPKAKTDWAALRLKESAASFGAMYKAEREARIAPGHWTDLADSSPSVAITTLHKAMTESVKLAATALPSKRATGSKRWAPSERTRELFKEREHRLGDLVRGTPEFYRVKNLSRNEIVHAVRDDKRQWAEQITAGMQEAADRGDS